MCLNTKLLNCTKRKDENMTKKRKIDFWDIEDENMEVLSGYTDLDEAIEGIIEDWGDEPRKTLELCGYVRRVLDETWWAEGILEDIIERLDDEYGGEDSTEITEEMKKAAKSFVRKMTSLYTPRQHEIVERKTIDVAAWVKENRKANK